jgi:hypothetical protein
VSQSTQAWAIEDAKGRIWKNIHGTRAAAIAYHVAWCIPAANPQPDQFVHGGRLDQQQRVLWRESRRRGERAVKVKIVWRTEQ